MVDEEEADQLRVGPWVPDEESGALQTGENTLGRRFAWPEEVEEPGLSLGPVLPDPDPESFASLGAPWMQAPPTSTLPDEGAERLRYDEGDERVRYDELDSELRYRGQRRAPRAAGMAGMAGVRRPAPRHTSHHRTLRRWRPDRRWMLISAVVALSATLAVLLILAASPMHRTTGVLPNGPGTAPGAGPGGASAPASPSPGPAMSATPSLRPTGKPTGRAKGVPPPKAPSFGPLAPTLYEAEARGNVLGGSAEISPYFGASGGNIVRNIGNWGSALGPGTLTFTRVYAPVNAVYILTFFYVHPDNEAQRTAIITVDGADTIAVTVDGSAMCCASKAVMVPLQKGTNTVAFANPNGHAPSIDRIVLSSF